MLVMLKLNRGWSCKGAGRGRERGANSEGRGGVRAVAGCVYRAARAVRAGSEGGREAMRGAGDGKYTSAVDGHVARRRDSHRDVTRG
jgi:hypothetical protein